MSRPAIKIENLGKRYIVDHERKARGGGYRTLRESLVETAAAPLKRLQRGLTGQGFGSQAVTHEEFWALKDVSFEVQPGEVVGIIGRNGAGKSTLLKILSQITKPTKGRVELNGRVGSLLEVGTGFHPELTGRENIYLNGSILGMKKTEIDSKFDEIVAFAEIEQFLDTPVKRYSSGMYVRLAFAIAAHLQPEVLIIDEVLAVGDAEFQSKCMGRMREVAESGRTIFFVSHNVAAVRMLCTRGIFLQAGSLSDDDTVESVVTHYMRTLKARAEVPPLERRDRGGLGNIRVSQVHLYDAFDNDISHVAPGEPVTFVFDLDGPFSAQIRMVFAIYDPIGQLIIDFDTKDLQASEHVGLQGAHSIKCSLPELNLTPGNYHVNIALLQNGIVEDHLESAIAFEITEGLVGGRPVHSSTRGCVVTPHRWTNAFGL